jgi:ketosteroid isomerase-like protein
MSTKDVIQSYYDSLTKKDDKWQELYADDSFFSDASQTLRAEGKAAIIQLFIPFLKRVEALKVKQMIVEGEHACAIVGYAYINPKGEKMSQDVAEVWEVTDGKLAKLTIYLDLTAFQNFMMG